MVATAAFAAQFRTESLLVIPVAALTLAVLKRDEMTRPRLWGAALVGLVLCGTLIAHTFAVRGEPWGSSGARMALSYVPMNLSVNGPFYYADWRFPAIYSILAVVGLLWASSPGPALIVLVNFAVFWLAFLCFYAGSYNFGADVRYSLMTYPPLAILAGVGAARIVTALERRWPTKRVAAGMAALLGFQFLLYMPYVRSVGEEAWAARADVEFARQFATMIPKDGIVLTHNPNMFLLWGVNAAQTSLAVSQGDYVRQHLMQRYRGGVFMHWGFWCNVGDPVQVGFAQRRCQDSHTNSRHHESDGRTVTPFIDCSRSR